MKIFAINNNFNNKYIPFANNSNGTQPVKSDNETNNDSFQKQENNKLSNNTKIVIGIALIALLITGICLLKGKKVKSKGDSSPNTMPKKEEPKSYPQANNEKPPVPPQKTPEEQILSQFEEYEQRRMNSKPRTQMTTEEIEEDCRWYREEYFPLLEKIKQQNISTIPHKIFSDNPLEQVQEKHDYIRYVLSRMSDNEASYYDGMIAFEKYGINGPVYDTGDYSRLSFIKINFPKTITKRCVNKLMDLYEKFAKGLYLDKDGFLAGVGDDISYMSLIAEKGAITSIPQLKRALEKGKKFIWNNDGIKELHSTLTYGENAPFKNNQEVEEIIQEFYQTAFNNRTPFKDYPDIKAKETQLWGIHRD